MSDDSVGPARHSKWKIPPQWSATVGNKELVASDANAADMCADCVLKLREGKCGAGGGSRTLTGLLSPADFLTVYGFRRPDGPPYPVCGLDYPFTVPQ